MSSCTHPTSALFVDRQNGGTTCTICGDVVMSDQYELDPLFAQGGRQPAGGGGGLRGLAGSFRPATSYKGTNTSMTHSHSRPTIDKARREMLNISRQLEISEDTVERALGIYKVALNMNAVSGTRPSVLCACLYAACRRERTSHVIYDFAEINGEDPHAILSQMKYICHATHTEVPVIDPSCYVQRFAEQMDLGPHTTDVVVCALKVLRAMQDDWISCGRRPMGVCAAALLVACYVFGIARTPEQVCGMVRLTSNTISKRLTEFAATPTARLENIDDYQPSHETLPPAFNDSSRKSTEEDVHASMRELSAIFYELVSEAKTSQPATPERCDKWRRFIMKHCELEGITPLEENLDLNRLSPAQQLHILGLPHTTPIPLEEVARSVKREEHRLLIKREASLQDGSDGGGSMGGIRQGVAAGLLSDAPTSPTGIPFYLLPDESLASSLAKASPGVGHADVGGMYSASATAGAAAMDSPEQLQWMTNEYTRLLNSNAEVMGLRDDFDFADEGGANGFGGSYGDGVVAPPSSHPTQNQSFNRRHSPLRGESPFPGTPAEEDPPGFFDRDDEVVRLALEEILYDRERRHALPWEFLVLPQVEGDDCTDILPYLVLDNEERLRRERVGLSLYGEKWKRGRARTYEEIQKLEEARASKRRRRSVISEAAVDVPTAMERALRGRGAGTVNISQIDELLPGMLEGFEDEPHADWD
ncbi:transcription factor, putative [Leishmania tarentolae]|uniref:Transcription factor, putative n=1 Tax=Leishmania tarentolae TaxID=5689 RepID=A0A640KHV5_LEITA|nr:transcription factor, putative [Leishmania tarentolae]